MTSENTAPQTDERAPVPATISIWEHVRCPELTPSAEAVGRLVKELPKRLDVYAYKKTKKFLWVVFLGGTGTGKSTLYNALCGRDLSETGVERPTTYGPIIYAHRETDLESGFPFASLEVQHIAADSPSFATQAGAAGCFSVLEHTDERLAHLVVVDTPDLDSLEPLNRKVAEDLYLLSDVVVFVTSQEKYADDVPYQFLLRIHGEKKPYFLLLNKAGSVLVRDEVIQSFRSQGFEPPVQRFWLLPYAFTDADRWIPSNDEFENFQGRFFEELDPENLPHFLREERKKDAAALAHDFGVLFDLLQKERRAADNWRKQLDELYDEACRILLESQQRQLTEGSKKYLAAEVKKIFSKYDVLAKPRRAIGRVVRLPLRLLGLIPSEDKDSTDDALHKIHKKTDLVPIMAAVVRFNRTVLEKLSPADECGPLFRRLRESGIILTEEEISARVWEEEQKLLAWLEQTVIELAAGIPRGKELGIYSTSVVWGVMILVFETMVGGGLSLVEAGLDFALAPFVTKGAAELFAYSELQRIAKELAKRYRDGLISVVGDQRDRYAECLNSLLTTPETLETLRQMKASVEREVRSRG